MWNAIWLMRALPEWYFSTVLNPLGAGPLTLVPACGVVCLVVGIVWGALIRRIDLALFILPAFGSHALVVVAGFMRGALTSSASDPVLAVFLILQLAAIVVLLIRLKGARFPSAFLSVFAFTYALFASFIASMSFTDVWL